MNNKNERLKELQAKEELNNEEMKELVQLSEKKSFKVMPNAYSIGITNLDRSFKNFSETNIILKGALEKGFYLEAISLGLQSIEFWLRMFWVVKNKKGRTISKNDKKTFGMILNDCKNLGFDQVLFVELKELNTIRVSGIHKFILGEIDYNLLEKESKKMVELIKKVINYVGNEVGIPIN